MNEPRTRRGARSSLALLFALAIGSSPAGSQDLRLARASADSAGGGAAFGPSYRMVIAFGQHDAQPPAYGATHAYAGGVFAAVPTDRLFGDGFE